MNKSLYLSLLFTTLLLFSPIDTDAHNGGRDELGGHFRSSDCAYLLHNPTDLARSATNMNELIELIHQSNSNEKCKAGLTPDKVDLEGYSFPGGSGGGSSSKPPATASPSTPPATGLVIGEKYTATLEKCTDGDTANFNIDGTVYKTRFLYIDTPESTIEKEPFGKEASEFTCSFLKQGTITLETDGKDLFDHYDRLLAWIWVDDNLHQEEITKAGFVEDFYDYGDYKYEDIVVAAMGEAKSNYRGIYEADRPAEETAAPPEAEKEEVENALDAEDEAPSDDAEETGKAEEKDTVKEKEQSVAVSSDSASNAGGESEEVGDATVIMGLLLAGIFFLLPSIKRKFGGVPCIIAHRLRAKRWWINVILFLVYAALWWITLIVIVMEVVHLLVARKASAV